jgi:DNA-binding transcriptional MerR regulator
LLKRPPRSEGGFRLFNAQDLRNLQFIRRAQQLGFSLNEIRELLFLQEERVEACTHVRDMLQAKLGSVRKKVSELRKLETQLAKDLKKCERSLRQASAEQNTCPVLEEIADRCQSKGNAGENRSTLFRRMPAPQASR